MAPPYKRRRLSYGTSQNVTADFEDDVARIESTPAFSHGLEHIPHSRLAADMRNFPQHIEEVHIQTHQQAVPAPENHHQLHRRQGTAVSLSATRQVSVVASVGTDGSTTGLTTISEPAGISAYAATSTTTLISSPPASTPSDSPSSTSGGENTSSSASASASISSSIAASTSSAASSASSVSPTASVASTASGFIGFSASGGTAPSATIATNSNGTVTDSPSNASGSAKLPSVTTSAMIIVGNSTTYTTRSTITLSSATSSFTSSETSSTLGGLVYLATLSNGRVETITRSNKPYATTFPDGQVSTIAPASGSLVVTTLSDGATSTLFETTSPSQSGSPQSTITSTAYMGASPDGSGSATSSSSSSTSRSGGGSGGGNGSGTTAPPGTIAGGVVGGAAGLAVVLLIAMLFLRWYRRKAQVGHQALPANTGMSPEPDQQAISRGPGMAERAGMMPFIGAVPALFRHQNRSRESTEPEHGERGFTRVSGRKLPSSFSPGMSSPPPSMPLTGGDRNLSTTSFYRDSTGFYGGSSNEPTPPTELPTGREEMTLSPGPQRRPTVHAGGPYTLSPPASTPTSPRDREGTPRSPPGTIATAASFERSDTPSSLDPNRSSKFTEEV